jgi:hypothetical protein
MNGVRIRRKLESDTLHLPEIKPLIGKTVEILIREETATAATDPGCFDDVSPVKPLDEPTKHALRALLTKEQFRALVEVVDQGGPDVDAIRKLRAASMV